MPQMELYVTPNLLRFRLPIYLLYLLAHLDFVSDTDSVFILGKHSGCLFEEFEEGRLSDKEHHEQLRW